jgi:lipopolysaccharide biosynthesis glycosyltransferase
VTSYAVVVVTDANLYDETRLVLQDLVRHCTGEPDLYCFHSGLLSHQLARLAAVPRVTLLPVSDVKARVGPVGVYTNPALGAVFYARFECWSDLFIAYDSVIYLDADTIVLGDLAPMTRADFLVAPQKNSNPMFLDDRDDRLAALLKEDGLSHDIAVPANAGVFALGRRFRTADQRALIDRIIVRYGPYLRVGDQSVLNVWMHTNSLVPTMDPTYNCQVVNTVGAPGGLRAVSGARLLHFNGFPLHNQRFGIRNARLWLRVPHIGRYLFAGFHHAIFHGREKRPVAARILRVLIAARDRMKMRFDVARRRRP